MSPRIADTVAIGLLAGLSCLFTAYAVSVPIWVLFIAWASFFAAGGGLHGALRSLTMSVIGIASATVTLLAATALGGSPLVVAGCVVVGAGVLVLIRNGNLLSFTPAGFFGFACTVGTLEATDLAINSSVSLTHPVVLVLGATVCGIGFGLGSQKLGSLLAGSTATASANPAT